MHAILTTMGTAGDVLPFVAVGVGLRAAGHRVTVVAPEPFESLARREGLAFESLICREEHERLLGNPAFWHPIKGPGLAARWGVRYLPRQYELLARLARDDDAVLVTNPAIVVARIIHEQMNRPLATMLLQPWMIGSNRRPPVMAMGMSLPRWAPPPAKRLYWRAIDAIGDGLMARELNALRAELRMAPVKRIFQWWMSPQLMLGMFPAWFGDPQPDWPSQVRMAGFPLYDGTGDAALPPELDAFVNAGEAPVAITFGTGMMHGHQAFRDCVEACRIVGRRAVALTGHPRQLPSPLPSFVTHVPFAPFRRLFSRCAAVIHHGGIGTIAQSLAAGTPQLVLPISWDQYDNAVRVRQLGAGRWMGRYRRSGPRIADALAATIREHDRAGSAQIRQRFAGADPVAVAVREIESLS